MKIFSVDKIRKADAYTIEREPISSINLMERAATQLFLWLSKRVDNSHTVKIFAGPGNNGGDGLALSRMLAGADYKVEIFIVRYTDKTSDDFNTNYGRATKTEGCSISDINSINDFPEINEDEIVIDAIFGSGLTRPIEGFPGKVIKEINKSTAIKIAIDTPSGIFSDSSSVHNQGAIVCADYTLSFQFPKLAFMMPENDPYVGEWHVLDIGLHADYINNTQTANFFSVKEDVVPLVKKRRKFSHKGTYGHALLIAGSYGKMGAAVLAAEACLRSGVGLLHTHIPKVGYQIMQTALPEAMISLDRYENYFSEVPDLSLFNSVGIGSGLGMEHQSQMALKLLIQEFHAPMVFDADALNILSENPTWLAFLSAGSILTPHPKEFERLAGKWHDDFERLALQRDFAKRYNVYVVLKGANTSVCTPDGKCYFNSTGNPGMATAGSGDVLTGIITGLLAQGYSSGQAAVLGVYLHGLAGDIAAKKLGQEAMIAGDMIRALGKAWRKLE
ncbi:MAG: bifunctional ADP-dependent NAD(P)H-hydrate dehydratase/NAD(P)H-hydrate epimerase [Bacteroidetes bacterium]|nr:MAG: bifunctional ADP-dependent NAD(P)H-hydrate dehydratase/NAD(P)H-hydrate epimerase [Bacteroidota bacterium]